jgi:cysteinyl-tRNA synthetase
VSDLREIKLTNTLTGKKEVMKTLEPGKVSFYSCGPTVYNFFHIGNARAFLTADLITRVLKYAGYEVNFVRNYTDVDDKIINKANEEGVSASDISEKYIKEAEKDFESLNLLMPDTKPTVTDHMGEIIQMISDLIDNGHAYVAEGEVFYSIESNEKYGALSGKNIEDLIAGARVEPDAKKKNPLDFTLWKPAKEGEPFWDSPWSKGRPGWHIECSAMSTKYLGANFDLHHGGVDLVFPHHENEIAQSEGATGKPFVNYWVHNEFMNISGEKMSKSLGNFILLRDFVTKYGAEVTRYMVYSAHYRTPLDFAEENIHSAVNSLDRYYSAISNLCELVAETDGASGPHPEEDKIISELEAEKEKFIEALTDDFNTAKAFGFVFNMIRTINRMGEIQGVRVSSTPSDVLAWMKNFQKDLNSLLGVMDRTPEEFAFDRDRILSEGKSLSDDDINGLIEERKQARANKDFARSDEIRDQLNEAGVEITDSPQGTTWKWK